MKLSDFNKFVSTTIQAGNNIKKAYVFSYWITIDLLCFQMLEKTPKIETSK